jgi:conserved domain protein
MQTLKESDVMAVISIKFNNKEENIIKNYAKTKGFSISQLIKDTLMERIAEEYDLEVCKKYLKMKVEETLVTIPFEEAIKEWDLE